MVVFDGDSLRDDQSTPWTVDSRDKKTWENIPRAEHPRIPRDKPLISTYKGYTWIYHICFSKVLQAAWILKLVENPWSERSVRSAAEVGHEVHAQLTKPQGFSSALLGTFTESGWRSWWFFFYFKSMKWWSKVSKTHDMVNFFWNYLVLFIEMYSDLYFKD